MPIDGQPLANASLQGNPVLARESHRLSLVGAAHRGMAHWLIDHEMGEAGAADRDELPAVVERICRKFFKRLARVTSLAACQALLSRALHIPRADFAFLEGVRAGSNAEPLIEGLRASVAGVEIACPRVQGSMRSSERSLICWSRSSARTSRWACCVTSGPTCQWPARNPPPRRISTAQRALADDR